MASHMLKCWLASIFREAEMDYNPTPSELDEGGQSPRPYFERHQRVLLYNNRFAIRLTRRERSAARVRVTVETLQSGSGYLNYEYNPPSGAYWRYTAHDGDQGVTREGIVRARKQVVYNFVNAQLIDGWNNLLNAQLSQSTTITVMAALVQAIANGFLPGLAGVTLVYNAALTLYLREQRDRWVDAELATALTESLDGYIGTPILRIPFFPSPESLWKFTALGGRASVRVTIEHWRLPDSFPEFFEIEQPDSTGEDSPQGDTDESDLEPPPQPDPIAPPPVQSPLDPRNDGDDYDNAPVGGQYPPGTMWRCSGEGGLNADPAQGLECRGDGITYVDIVESTTRPYFVTERNLYLNPDRGCQLQRVWTSNGPASTPSGGQIGYFRNGTIEGPL